MMSSCSICLDELHVTPDRLPVGDCASTVAGLKGCGHLFHTVCIQDVLRQSGEVGKRCPCCRGKASKKALFYVPVRLLQLPSGNQRVDHDGQSNEYLHQVLDRCKSLATQLEDCNNELQAALEALDCARKAKEKAEKSVQTYALQCESLQKTLTGLQQESRTLQRSLEKARRLSHQEADKRVAEIQQRHKMEIQDLKEYNLTLQRDVQRAELIARPHQYHTPDDWSVKFTQAVEGFTKIEHWKQALFAYHSKLETAERDVMQWKDRAGIQKSKKDAAAKEIHHLQGELQHKTQELVRLQKSHEDLRQQACESEENLERVTAQLGDLKTLYRAAREELGTSRGKLAEVERMEKRNSASHGHARNRGNPFSALPASEDVPLSHGKRGRGTAESHSNEVKKKTKQSTISGSSATIVPVATKVEKRAKNTQLRQKSRTVQQEQKDFMKSFLGGMAG